jgi:hypothetical protein
MRLPVIALLAISAGGESCDWLLGPSTCTSYQEITLGADVLDSSGAQLGSVTHALVQWVGEFGDTGQKIESTFKSPATNPNLLSGHVLSAALVTGDSTVFNITVSPPYYTFEFVRTSTATITSGQAAAIRNVLLVSPIDLRMTTNLQAAPVIITRLAPMTNSPWRRSCQRT